MDRRRFSLLLFAALAPLRTAHADEKGRDSDDDDDDDRDDADRALDGRRSGRILPLADIIRIVRSQVPGRIVEMEFDDDDGVPVYEFYVIQSGGRRREVTVDARSGRILEIDED